MSDTRSRKNHLRSELRRRRKLLSVEQQLAAAQALTRSIGDLPGWPDAQRIALYFSADGEIDTQPLATMARTLGKLLFLPAINEDNSLTFARWDADDPLPKNRFNIPEPSAEAVRWPASRLDIIFLPLVGWDLRGGRLGMGAGFYDRTLTGVSGPLLVGLAHDSQQVEEVPIERWDVALNYIATDSALYRCQGM